MIQANTQEDEFLKDEYILGQPFLRAFIVILDYEENTIGLANKINNNGAEILGEKAPGPHRKYYKIRDFEKDEEDETFIPVDSNNIPTDNW